jgi:polygalacturonase
MNCASYACVVTTILSVAVVTASAAEPDSAGGMTTATAAQSAMAIKESAQAWAQTAEIEKRIHAPTFPAREFLITNYGAVSNGTTDCSQAFQQAVEACSKSGGGKVVVPAGTYLSGPIQLESNVNLYLAKDATIRFSTDPAKYLPVVFTRFESTEVMNYSPFVYAFGQQNIAITGEGTLDGQASAGEWYKWKKSETDVTTLHKMGDEDVPVAQRIFGEGHHLRPNFVQPYRCNNVLIEGIHVTNSPMWVLTPTLCTNVTVRNVTVNSKGAPNTDGCDPDSCTDVLIDHCVFNTGDDCIALKAGRNRDGRRVNVPCENIIIRNCQFEAGHGGITAGSESSGGIRNVFAENCSLDSPDMDMAFRLKSNPLRGGFIENFNVRDCTVKTAQFGIHITMRYENVTTGDAIPYMRDIRLEDVRFEKLTKAPIFIEGLSDTARVGNVTLINCTFPVGSKKNQIVFSDNVLVVQTTGDSSGSGPATPSPGSAGP